MTQSNVLDPLASGLLPALLHRLANTTQLLSGLNSLALLGMGEDLWRERASDVEAACEQAEELGYLLAVVGSGGGADLLGTRRSPQGLRWTVGLLREGLRRRGLDLGPDPEPWPLLASAAPEGWRLPWAVAELLWMASEGMAPDAVLSWSLEADGEAHRLLIRPDGASAPSKAWRAMLEERLAAASLEILDDTWRLIIPGDWLREAHPVDGASEWGEATP